MATNVLTNAGPILRTQLPGPNARRILEADKKYISPSYTRSYPMVAKRGRGIMVEDVDGNEFMDFAAGIAVCSTGHCHPEVVDAIQKQAGELIHMSGTDFYYENMVTLAERLSKIAPMKGPHRVYYGNSGTEAVEAAMKLARYHTRRQNIIAFYGAFHGRTMGSLVADGVEAATEAALRSVSSRRDARALSRFVSCRHCATRRGGVCSRVRALYRRPSV